MHSRGFLAGFLVAALPSLAWGQAVGSEFQANTYTTNDQRRPAVGVLSDGKFVVVWQSNSQPSPASPTTGQDGDSGGIFAQLFNSSGDKLGDEFQVNTYTPGGQFRPSVAVDLSTDRFIIVWDGVGSGDPDNGIFARRFNPSGSALDTSEFLVNSYTAYGQYLPEVATDASGNFVVVWEGAQEGGSGFYGSYGIFARRFESDGTPVDSDDFQVNTYEPGYQGDPEVAMHATGEFVVVWSSNDYDYPSLSQDGSYAGVFARRFDSSGVALDTSEFQVNTYPTGYQYRPTVAVDEASGGFVVAWSGYTSAGGYGVSGNRIYGCHGEPLCPPSGDHLFETSGGSSPALAGDSANLPPPNFVVVWQSNHDGDFSGVFGQRFYGTFYPIGGEFQVNAYVTGNQVSPAIGMNDSGDAVVAWTSGTARRQFTPPGPTQDGDRDGVFGQVCGSTDTDPPTVEVRSPMATATLYAGKNYTITWTAADNCGLTSFNVLVSTDGGNTFSSICSNLPGTARSCTWTAPLPLTSMGRVRVVADDPSNNSGLDDSNADFKVVSGTPSVTVTAPNSKGISWQVGSTQQIKWKHNLGNGELVRIEVNRNYPNNPNDGWNIVTEAAPSGGAASGAFNWVVTPPFLVDSRARIRITALGHTTATDVGDANFAITSRVKVTQPNTALAWAIGTTQTIKWTHNYGANQTFNIQIDRDSNDFANPLETIASNVLGTGSGGSFKWFVTGPITNEARIRVVKTGDGRGNDISDEDFTITQ